MNWSKKCTFFSSGLFSLLILSGIFLAALFGSLFAGAVIVYEPPKGLPETEDYKIAVDDKAIFVYTTPLAKFGNFSFNGKIRVKVTTKVDLKSVDIRPKYAGIKPEIQGKTLEFDLDAPKNLSIEVNGDLENPLFLFANELESAKPDPKDPNVMYFAGGQVHEIGNLQIESGKTVYIEGGAVLSGAFKINGKQNVKILGRGIIDSKAVKGRVVRIEKSSEVTLDGPIFLNCDNWAVVAGESDRLQYKNIKIINWNEARGGTPDGMDFVGCTQVAVDGVFIRSFDDGIAVKNQKFAWKGNTENIKIKNAVVWNGPAGNALSVGWELGEEYVRDLGFQNIDIIHKSAKSSPFSRAAIGIHQVDKASVSGLRYEDIRIEDCQERFFSFRVFSSPDYKADGRGSIKNVVLKNIQITGGANLPSVIEGFDDQHAVENVVFENLRILGKPIANAEQGGFTLTQTSGIQFILPKQ